ncbi:MAG: hypothetical protein KC502_12585 [Myxococcales bacterium]|nr:hypothetical protein [Myxococcales bacterium]
MHSRLQLPWLRLSAASRVGAVIFALFCQLLIAGCAVEQTALDPLPFGACLCDGACPTTVCDIEIELDKDTCKDQLDIVEIMIGKQLETTIWEPGLRQRSCGTIKRGAQADFFARADTGWRWQESISCPAAGDRVETKGPTIVRVLHCSTQP